MNSIIPILLLILTTVSCSAAKNVPIAENNEVLNGMIPMSRVPMPDRVKDLAQKKEEYILSFFKTPAQQMMPLGMYSMFNDARNVKALRQIRSHGINLAHCYAVSQCFDKAMENLDAARNAGIGVLQNLPGSYMEEKSSQWWHTRIQTLAQDKQLVLWYLPEERPPEDVDDLQKLADMIRSQDPYKRPLITFLEGQEGTLWQDVSAIVDGLVLGYYPCHRKNKFPRADKRRYIDFAFELGVPVVFSSLEAFKKEASGYRWPTSKEARFDAYLSLISGSKGLMWYGYAYLKKNPELFGAVMQIAQELNGPTRLGEVFLTGQRVESIKCQLIKGSPYAPETCTHEKHWWKKKENNRIYSTIQWLALKHNNAMYIFAVNMNEKVTRPDHGGKDYAVTVKFENLPSNITEAQVMFENRQLTLEANSFADSFTPLGTHIYRLQMDEDPQNMLK